MNKYIPAILTIIAVLVINNSFALSSNLKNCGFPHHFKIIGPQNVHIVNAERVSYPQNNLSVINQTADSFDVVQLNDQLCNENDLGGGAISLNVGTDDKHYVEMTMVDGLKRITLIRKISTNRFDLKEINDSNKPIIKLFLNKIRKIVVGFAFSNDL